MVVGLGSGDQRTPHGHFFVNFCFSFIPGAFCCLLFSCSVTQILFCVKFTAFGKDDVFL